MINIRSVIGKEGLTSIKDEWIDITNRRKKKKFYQLYEWYESYLDFLEPHDTRIFFFILYENNIPYSIFPLKLEKRKIFYLSYSLLEIPDHPHIDLSDFIYCDNFNYTHLKYFIDFLKKKKDPRWDALSLPHICSDSKIINYLKKINFSVTEPVGKSNYLSCDQYKNRLSKNFKGNLRKAKNKLFNYENVEFVSANTSEELRNLYETFLVVEESGWKGSRGTATAIRLHDGLIGFYKSLIENLGKLNCSLLNFLKIGNEYVSGQFCIIVDDTCFILKIGYNEAYKNISPGNLLLENMLNSELIAAKGVRYINLVTGMRWHEDWKPFYQDIYRVKIIYPSGRGLLLFVMLMIRKYFRSRQTKPICEKL